MLDTLDIWNFPPKLITLSVWRVWVMHACLCARHGREFYRCVCVPTSSVTEEITKLTYC